MRLPLLILFIVAFVPQAVLIWSAWIVAVEPNSSLIWAALSLSGMCVMIMAAIAIATQNPSARWLSVGLVGIVLVAFSALTIVSLGLLTSPIALALIVLSIIMLIRNRRSLPADA